MERTYLPVSLPSKCKVYSGVSPDDIAVSAYTGGDEVFIAELNMKRLDEKFCAVLGRVLKGIDPKRLTLGDRTYLMVWLCVNSYSNIMKTKVECPYCNNTHEQNCDLNSVQVKTLPGDYVEPQELTLSSGVIKVRLNTIADQIDIDRMENSGMKDIWLYRWAKSIVNDKSAVDNMKWLESMPSKDVAIIRGFHQKYEHGPVMEFNCHCDKCGEDSKEVIPFRIEWFLPAIP